MKLRGKRVVITGANQGFGFAVAKLFVNEGASVLLCARDQKLLEKAKSNLKDLAKGVANIYAEQADVAKLSDNKKLLQSAINNMGGVDILVLNAGVYGPKGPIEDINWEEWSAAIDINLKGVVMACHVFAPHLKKQKTGKIIILSGGGATKPLPFLSAYAASKAGVVRFGETIAEELRGFNIDVNMVAPGALNTRLLDEVLAAGPEKVGKEFYNSSLKQKEQGGSPLEEGAALCAYLASSESNGITGKLISAVWDPWEKLHEKIVDLEKSDIYTLRRIVPKDRGKDWGEKK